MASNETGVTIDAESMIPRRKFVSAAAFLVGAGLFSAGEVKAAASRDVCSEFLTVPGPADVLVDLLDFLFGIESGILGPYYGVVGQISGELSTKYSDLKKAAAEFRRLVPELRAGTDVSRFQNLAQIGFISAAFVGNTPISSGSAIRDQSKVVRMTSTDLEQTARYWNAETDTLKLSPAAVAKLKEMLRLIAALETPTTSLESASDALTKASREIREKVGQVRPLLKDATRLLVAADIIETPPPRNADGSGDIAASVIKRLAKNNEPTKPARLRELAVQKITDAAQKLGTLSQFVVPEELARYRKASAEKPDPNAVSIDVLQKLLIGTVAWIKRGNDKPENVSLYGDQEVRFIPASMTSSNYAAGWVFDLWGQIRGILADIIPQATYGRIFKLYGRKLAASGYSAGDQYKIFYNLLPNLAQPNDIDLAANDTVRAEAARRLSRL